MKKNRKVKPLFRQIEKHRSLSFFSAPVIVSYAKIEVAICNLNLGRDTLLSPWILEMNRAALLFALLL